MLHLILPMGDLCRQVRLEPLSAHHMIMAGYYRYTVFIGIGSVVIVGVNNVKCAFSPFLEDQGLAQ